MSKMSINNRKANYELLRMLAGMAVVILHFNYFPGGGGAVENATGITFYFLFFLESLCICAVNVFILLSGFFNCNSKKIRAGKLLEIYLQTVLISFVINSVHCIVHHDLDIKLLLVSFIPVNYFVVLYIALMILAPYINKLMNSLSEKNLTRLTFFVFLLFSVYSTGVDVLKEVTGSPWEGLSSIGLNGSMNGYSIVNFIMLYIIGAWLRKTEPMKRAGALSLIGILIGSILVIMLWRHFLPGTAWSYNNPVIILEACIIFLIFGRIKLSSALIVKIAPATFSCFLIQGKILELLHQKILSADSFFGTLLLLAIITIGIYLISILVMEIWNLLVKKVKKLIGKQIPDVCIEES